MPSAVVIGAGPAGSAAAHALARAGWEVTVVEARAFPRPKVCGEFVSPAATHLLEAIIPERELLPAGARRITTLVIEQGGRRRPWSMAKPGLALSRGALDSLLLEAARGAGATVLNPARAESVDYDGSGVSVRLAGGDPIRADVVLHADGAGRHDPAGPVPNRRGVVALKCHLRLPGGREGGNAATLRMRSCPGAYVGVMGVEGGLSVCALVARAELVRSHAADMDAMLASLWPEYQIAWRDGPWLSSGVPASGYVVPGHARSVRVGNAAAAVEPLGGEGIGLALWSGATAAGMLERCGGNMTAFHARFARAYRRKLLTRLPACRAAAWALTRPRLVRAAWPALAAPNLTIRPVYRLTGKPG